MATKDMDDELNMALEQASGLDAGFDHDAATPLQTWLAEFAPDPWAYKPKLPAGVTGGTVGENGLYYPDPKALRDPEDLRTWATALRADVLGLIVKEPGVTTNEIRATLATWPEHQDILKYYSLCFECITQRVMHPPYYMKLLNAMCDSMIKIRKGGDAIKAELELDKIKRNLKIEYGLLEETS